MLEAVEYNIRPSIDDDIDFFSKNIRNVDKNEIFAISNLGYEYGVSSSIKLSEECYVGVANGIPICIFGIRRFSLLSNYGIIWMLATNDLDRHGVRFIRECKSVLKKMILGFNKVENWCDKRNKITLRWLKWLGFTINEPKAIGRKGEMFHHFYIESD